MNKIIETIEKEKMIKQHRRGALMETDSNFLSIIPKPIREYFAKENIKSIESNVVYLGEQGERERHIWSIEYNDRVGIYSGKKIPEPENSMLKELLKKLGANKLIISEQNKQDQIQHHDFSWVNLLAGEEYNQELAKVKDQINLIDFNQYNHESPEFIERKIKEIYNNPQNKELMEKGDFPVICFKNIEKIGQNQALEEALLPVFDTQQNDKLFNKQVDLSKFILLATTSTYETEKLSSPLLSRLNWVNADTAQPKKFFLDKYYYWLLVPSLLINLILLTLLWLPKLRKKTKVTSSKSAGNKKTC
jgi:hypothetical protein